MSDAKRPPLAGVRVIESSLLGPAAITTHLADLGAEVIKVESPAGDYVREMTWPIVQGVSLLHLHVNRGKRSLTLDLRKPEAVEVYRELVRGADVVVEAMRPGSLERRGLGFEQLRLVNPRIVFCNISGYGMTGPYRDLPAHGIAFDSWAGIFAPKGTPKPVVDKLAAALDKALDDPSVVKRLNDLGGAVPKKAERTPASFDKLVKSEISRWKPILQSVAPQPKSN